MLIRIAQDKDLPAIAGLEKMLEDSRISATLETLRGRLLLYPEGFFVAEFQDQVVGYLESIRWNGPDFERFEQIKDYHHMHSRDGSELYITYMAVDPAYRKYGTAVQLLEAAEKMAASHRLIKIQLVALPKLVPFYRIMGFRRVRTLPHYLETSAGELMEKDLDHAPGGH